MSLKPKEVLRQVIPLKVGESYVFQIGDEDLNKAATTISSAVNHYRRAGVIGRCSTNMNRTHNTVVVTKTEE